MVSALDGRVVNKGVARYRHLEGRHLDPQGPRIEGVDVVALKTRTRQSRIEVAEAARTRVFSDGEELDVARSTYQTEDYVHQVLALELHEGVTVRVEKNVALYSGRDRGISEPLEAAVKSAARYPRFDEALDGHAGAWDELWEVCDIALPREERVQFLLRFHTAHLLQVCSRQTSHHDAGVPARGLNGEAYRGHVFWDELFAYPFLNFRLPHDHPRAAALPLPADRRGPRRRRTRPATAGRCTRGRAAATARRRPRPSTSTRSRASGSRTSAATSATSARRSSTPSGTTTWPRTSSTSCATAAPR